MSNVRIYVVNISTLRVYVVNISTVRTCVLIMSSVFPVRGRSYGFAQCTIGKTPTTNTKESMEQRRGNVARRPWHINYYLLLLLPTPPPVIIRGNSASPHGVLALAEKFLSTAQLSPPTRAKPSIVLAPPSPPPTRPLLNPRARPHRVNCPPPCPSAWPYRIPAAELRISAGVLHGGAMARYRALFRWRANVPSFCRGG